MLIKYSIIHYYLITLKPPKFMKNWLKIILIIALILISFGYNQPVSANPIFTEIKIMEVKNGNAALEWKTNEPMKGIVYFGDKADNLDRYLRYNVYEYNHRTILTGLEEEHTYYYKIIAQNQSGYQIETFIQNFSTEDMIDTINPELLNSHITQVTDTAAALYWQTDEKTKATIYYGISENNLDKTKKISSYEKEHELFLYKLKANQRYYLRIVVADKAGNQDSSAIFEFKTSDAIDQYQLEISSLEPINFDAMRIFSDMAIFTWNTNLASKGYLKYGTKSGRYSEKIYSAKNLHKLNHKVVLTALQPNTTYYYKITAYDSLHKKSFTTAEMTFTTTPKQTGQVLGTKIIAGGIDADNDGLSDNYELELGTNPLNSDTDGDGYPDGLEVSNGYNPKGAGRFVKLIYNQPRISLGYEQEKAKELKSILDTRLGRFRISNQDWFTLVNAYVYGGYPIEAVTQSIKFSGKTVHPTIPWYLWKNTLDYSNYINK